MIQDSVMVLGCEYQIIKVKHDQYAACDGWLEARGCRIESSAAAAYGLKSIYEEE